MKKKEPVAALPNTVLIVYVHPEPQSWTGIVKDRVEETFVSMGYEVQVSDLYGINFNPVTSKDDFLQIGHADFISLVNEQKHAVANGMQFSKDLRDQIEKVLWATYCIVITPFWWGGVPAILKGWFDRVFVAGLLWDYEKFYKSGKMKGKKAQIIIAQGEAESVLHKHFLKEIQIDELLKTLTWGTFHFCGYDVLHTQKLLNAEALTLQQKEEKLAKVTNYLKNIANQPQLYEFGKH